MSGRRQKPPSACANLRYGKRRRRVSLAAYILRLLIPVLLGVSFIVYTILSFTPGDPVQMMLGDNYSEESYAAMQEELGLDDPFLVQYGRFIINAVHGDFGTSYSTGNPVAAEIAARLPNTILLSACAMLFAILIGIPLGVISATHQYSAVDNISMVGALFGVSMPNFWLGLMLIVIFAAGLGWFPSSNFETWGALVLPAVTLSANSLAMITRMTRSSMLETIRQDYIRTARAKGLKESVITIRHALRNAMRERSSANMCSRTPSCRWSPCSASTWPMWCPAPPWWRRCSPGPASAGCWWTASA